jgi:hypothetical protein
MCRSVHVRLTLSERKEVARWSGIMIPVYTSIVVFVLVTLIVTHQPRTGEMITAAGDTTASGTGNILSRSGFINEASQVQ